MTAMAATLRPSPIWRRLVGFNFLAGLVLGVVGWYVGWFGAHAVVGPSIDYFGDIDYNELSVVLAYRGVVLGFLGGLGFLNCPLPRLRAACERLMGGLALRALGYAWAEWVAGERVMHAVLRRRK